MGTFGLCRSVLGLALVLSRAETASAGRRPDGEQGWRAHRARISASGNHTCSILDDATVRCWGRGANGELGNGSFPDFSATPVQVSGLIHAISLASGAEHVCALRSESVVDCWGNGSFGVLGNGGTSISAVPVQVSNLSNVVAIAAGDNHSCAIRADGTVWCWGANTVGQLGVPTTTQQANSPIQVPGVSGASAITAGAGHTCVLLATGTVRCWGVNSSGQTVGSGLTGVADISAGSLFTCVRMADGTVRCWGDNRFGQLGSTVKQANGQVLVNISNVVAIGTGANHTCAILVDGTAKCWGSDSSGQIGDGTAGNVFSSPGPAVIALSDAVEITAGDVHTCAIDVRGTAHCWGDNSVGQHGNTNTAPTLLVDNVSGVNGTISARTVWGGVAFTCAIRGNATAACWGDNQSFEIGLGSPGTAFVPNPAAVVNLTNASQQANALGLSTGDTHTCAVDSSGTAKCWGDNNDGQLGNGTNRASDSPVTVTSGFPFISVSAGPDFDFIGEFEGIGHSCGVTSAFGLIRCWGGNLKGQLGTGDTNPSSVSTQVFGITNAVAVAAGNQFTCALIVDGTVRCWGDNSFGQLGNGGQGSFSPTPVPVPGLTNIIAIAASDHACALSAFGIISCWGFNHLGQIGNGTSSNSVPSPSTVGGISNMTGVSAGGSFTCAVRADSEAFCWGDNITAELAAADSPANLAPHLTPSQVIGTFTTVNTSSGPVTIPIPLSTIVAITAGGKDGNEGHACALLVSGAIRCWGSNFYGQVGNGQQGSDTPVARPALVNSFTANVDPNVTLQSPGRIASVIALINCGKGGEAHISLTLEQGAVTGSGEAVAACADQLLQVPIVVPAQGPEGFQTGAAVADVEALVKQQGTAVEDQHWTRAVVLKQ